MFQLSRLGPALAIATVALVGPAAAAPAPEARLRPPETSTDPKVPFEKYALPNGLEVILIPDTRVPLVAVNVWYHVGSGNEVVGKSGFAHLFEHMLFQGSKHAGSDRHFTILRRAGTSEVNGSTNADRTNYFEVVPSNQLETALWLESDRMGYLLPVLTEASFRNQVEVVRNERRQRVDNVPYGKARLATAEALYPEGHPYRYTTIGRHEDLHGASLDDVTAFFKTWYVPSNATLTLAGDFDSADARRLIEKWFGSFPASVKPVTAVPAMPTLKSRRIDVSDDFAKLVRVSWAWHTPAMFQPGDAELDIAADVLTDTGTGRLYKVLVHDRQLAESVAAQQVSNQFSSVFTLTVTLRTGADLDEVRRLVDAEVDRLRKEPATEREIRRTAAGTERDMVFQLESLLARAEQLQTYNHHLGDPARTGWDLDRYRKATPEAVRAIASTYLVPDRRLEVVTTPRQGASK